eukprot:symbB.v1.2.014902.t1/scaffold1101.1/size137853/12
MNCYLRMLQEQSDGQLWCPSSFFWPKLEAGGHAAVHRWARRAAVNVASCDALVVPLHLEGCHWSLAVMRIELRHILYLDSLGMPAPDLLQSRLSEFVSKEDPALSGLWQLLVVNKTPKQLNSSDCGIFVLAYAECIAKGRPLRVDASINAINSKADCQHQQHTFGVKAMQVHALLRHGLVVFIALMSYSDQADLPMSQRWRDEMKAKLASIDTDKLTPEQKKKFRALWRRVEGTSGSDQRRFNARFFFKFSCSGCPGACSSSLAYQALGYSCTATVTREPWHGSKPGPWYEFWPSMASQRYKY